MHDDQTRWSLLRVLGAYTQQSAEASIGHCTDLDSLVAVTWLLLDLIQTLHYYESRKPGAVGCFAIHNGLQNHLAPERTTTHWMGQAYDLGHNADPVFVFQLPFWANGALYYANFFLTSKGPIETLERSYPPESLLLPILAAEFPPRVAAHKNGYAVTHCRDGSKLQSSGGLERSGSTANLTSCVYSSTHL